MALVYLAHDLKHEREVALKVLRPELAASLGSTRFLQEISLLARLDHPHILPLLESGENGGFLYYLMPYVAGESLRDRLNREKQLSLDDAIHVTNEVADALAHAHARGIIHRDIKPANIMLADGHARVADFGIARAIGIAGGDRITETGLAIGTQVYMSPEQAVGDRELDHRTDIYSLGCLTYEMLAGQPPYTGATREAVLARQALEAVPSIRVIRPAIPVAIEAAIRKAMARIPAERFTTAPQFAEALIRARARQDRTPVGPLSILARKPLIVALLVALVALGWWALQSERAASARITSLAVLPFTNLGGDTADAYFADGVADELITALGKTPGLHVVGRASAFRFRDRRVDLKEIGRILGVSSLLESTVRRDGERIRVTTQLTSAADGLVLWSERYEGELKDLFSMQDEITRAIVEALQVRLSGATSSRTSPTANASPEAYDLYLKGLFLLQRRGTWIRNAIRYFEQAIDEDSRFAHAHAQLAIALALLPIYNPVSIDSVRIPARLSAETSIALDPTIAEAHTALGLVDHQTLDHAGALYHYERALSLDPNFPLTHQGLSNLLQETGRFDEAVGHTTRAIEIDPASPIALSLHTRALIVARRFAEALLAARRAAELDSLFPFALPQLALAEYFTGHFPAARAAALAATPVPATAGPLAFVLGSTEPPAAALIRARSIDRDHDSTYPEAAVSLAYVAARDTTRALDALERALRAHEPLSFSLSLGHPMFDAIRGSPRFKAVARAYGFQPH